MSAALSGLHAEAAAVTPAGDSNHGTVAEVLLP